MAGVPDEKLLLDAFSIIESTPDMEVVVTRLRDLLKVDHVVYFSSKLAGSPSPLSHYIRLTYPASWIKRYLQMGYIDIDPVVREGYVRILPFDWSELKIQSASEKSFWADALAHGVGPRGFSIPVRSKRGPRGLFTLSSTSQENDWSNYKRVMQSTLIQIANRVHQRVIRELSGSDRPHLSERELDCLRFTALGKDTGDIALILNISPYTVREYLKSARYKLDSVTSAQAVNKAVGLGLLIM
jgi:LuxR family transcriptional regulator, quorum-sensing system regulator CinR